MFRLQRDGALAVPVPQDANTREDHTESVAVVDARDVHVECCSVKELGDRVGGGVQVEHSCGKGCEMSVSEQSDVFVGPEYVVTWSDVGEIDPERLWVRGEGVADADDTVVVKGRLKECVPF